MDELKDWYNRSIKHYLNEIDRPNGVIANYMISIVKGLMDKDYSKQDIIDQTHDYAWDLSPWFKEPYPHKLFEVFDYYKRKLENS